MEYAFTEELSLFPTMGRAEVRGIKRRRIQEEEELVTSSIVQVDIKVLPLFAVFQTKLFGLLITRANIFFAGVHNADGGVHRTSRRGLEVHQVDQ